MGYGNIILEGEQTYSWSCERILSYESLVSNAQLTRDTQLVQIVKQQNFYKNIHMILSKLHYRDNYY